MPPLWRAKPQLPAQVLTDKVAAVHLLQVVRADLVPQEAWPPRQVVLFLGKGDQARNFRLAAANPLRNLRLGESEASQARGGDGLQAVFLVGLTGGSGHSLRRF